MRDDRPGLGPLLRRFREEAGHSSAREFFRSNGGRLFFGCTYEQYMNVETGRSAPSARLLDKAATALNLWSFPAKARRLVKAWLRGSLKDDGLCDRFESVLSAKEIGSETSPLRQALRRNYETRQSRLSDSQSAAIRGDETSFWCFSVLGCDDHAWGSVELAGLLRRPVVAVAKALAKLERAGVVERTREGLWRNAARGKILAHARKDPYRPDGWRESLKRYDAVEAASGETEMYETLMLRSSPASLRQFYAYLAQAVIGAGVYAADEPGERALFLVEGRVRRLLDLPERR